MAGVLAHPGFTTRFKEDLLQPGLRVPLTANSKLFDEACKLGREVVWLHTFGERFANSAEGRPARPPRLPGSEGPRIPKDGAIPGAPKPLPEAMEYDASLRRIRLGKGYVDNVSPAMWAYEVSGKQVLHQWFGYRKQDRSRPVIGDRRPPSALDRIQLDHWPAEYTSELLNLLHVLGRLVALEPLQEKLLQEICEGPLIDVQLLTREGALEGPAKMTDEPTEGAVQATLL